MKRYHWVILSMKDEQGAGNVFHTVKDTTMSQRLRAIPIISNTNTLGFSRKLNDKHVLWVTDCSSALENTIIWAPFI